MTFHKTITVKAPVNIAVIKYWGKIDEKLILPYNDSISGTLSVDQLCACTTVTISNKFTEDRFWLNNEEQNVQSSKRLQKCLDEIRKISTSEAKNYKMHICSKNNFPTASGLASSAAGYACLTYAIGKILDINDIKKLSIISRMGSGSACRSLYGGFVHWISSKKSENSFAVPIVNESFWPKIRVLILIVNNEKKETSSTDGMKKTAETSSLFEYRVKKVVPERIKKITKAIKDRNFHEFAELTMKDSNQFHAVCLDSYPPINYMTDVSRSIVNIVHMLNEYYGTNRVAYTFDAGPNACLYLLENEVDEVLTLINYLFPKDGNFYTGEKSYKDNKEDDSNSFEELDLDLLSFIDDNYYRGLPYKNVPLKKSLLKNFEKIIRKPNQLKGIISTKIGSGPIIEKNISLLNENGLPIII